MRTKSLRVTWVVLVIWGWAVLFVASGLTLWKERGCLINAGIECTEWTESERVFLAAGD
jgi:hypothetical protein